MTPLSLLLLTPSCLPSTSGTERPPIPERSTASTIRPSVSSPAPPIPPQTPMAWWASSISTTASSPPSSPAWSAPEACFLSVPTTTAATTTTASRAVVPVKARHDEPALCLAFSQTRVFSGTPASNERKFHGSDRTLSVVITLLFRSREGRGEVTVSPSPAPRSWSFPHNHQPLLLNPPTLTQTGPVFSTTYNISKVRFLRSRFLAHSHQKH